MVESFSPNAFYDSASEFARTALEAHHDTIVSPSTPERRLNSWPKRVWPAGHPLYWPT
jgi:hypothetical protein